MTRTFWSPNSMISQRVFYKPCVIHYWPRVRNILSSGHKLCIFMWLVYIYVFLEMLSSYAWWYGGLFWFRPNVQNSGLWLTRALVSPDTGRIAFSTFGHKCFVTPERGAIRGHNSIWRVIPPLISSYVLLIILCWFYYIHETCNNYFRSNKMIFTSLNYEIRMFDRFFWLTLQPWFCIAEIRQLIFLFDILVPRTNFNKSYPTFQGVRGTIGLTLSGE